MESERRALRGAARERFRALMKLASESPFEGERENAMAAATRLAAQHGMSVDEAARPTPRPADERPMARGGTANGANGNGSAASRFASYFDLAERNLRADKARREAALRDAFARGLDAEERAHKESPLRRRAPSSHSRRSPRSYARVLLAETSFSLKEIVDLTGLDIYEVVGLKLKMRSLA